MNIEVFRRMHTKAGKGSKFNSRKKRGNQSAVKVPKEKLKRTGTGDEREVNY